MKECFVGREGIPEVLLHAWVRRHELYDVLARASRQNPTSVPSIGIEPSEVFPMVPLSQSQLCQSSRNEAADWLMGRVPKLIDFREREARRGDLHHAHE